jgi:ribosomal subunit interface protein
MKLPLQVVFHDMAASPALQARAEDKARRLERTRQDIVSCRVDIAQLHKHRQQGRPFGVRLHVTVPGHEFTVDRVQNEDAWVALREAFDDMRRQLEEAARRRRGEEKTHALPLHGEVVRLFEDEPGTRGYGFIRTPEGTEYWFSRDSVADPAFEHLAVGERVQFLADAGRGPPQARRVSAGRHGFV